MLLGLLEMLIPQTTTVFFCLFNVLWVTLFLEVSLRTAKWLGTFELEIIYKPDTVSFEQTNEVKSMTYAIFRHVCMQNLVFEL